MPADASRRHDGRPRAPALNAAATVGPPSHSSPSPKAAHKADALAGLERWKARYPEAATRLHVDDVLVDSMRGRSTNWTRIRINLRNVPEGERPPGDPPEPDYDPWPAAAHG